MNDILEKALEYASKYRVIGRAHYLASDRYARFNRGFGIPVIVITAVVGTTIFGTFDQNPDPWLRIGAGFISLTGTVLASLQTTLAFAQTSEKHKAAGETYRSVRRKFEMFDLKFRHAGTEKREEALSQLEEIVASLDEIAKSFPSVPDRCYERAKEEQRLKEAPEPNPIPPKA
jgi:hypothetical protein